MSTMIVAAALAAILTAGAPAAVTDGDPTPPARATVGEIQQQGDLAIERRLTALDAAELRLGNAQSLDEGHRSSLEATITDTRSGLESLRSELDGAPDAASARDDYRSIFSDYRVYAVVLPQSYVVAGADRAEAVTIPRLQAAAEALEAAIDAQGRDDLADDLADLRSEIQKAQDDLDGLADRALAVAVDDFDADPAVMQDITLTARDAVLSLRSAVVDARTLADELR
ncbi:hypothetical protein [Protaetiibacter mangrovi]|uniref:Uncharacterized protein n=1 Tax=Protaetiibacter mangrovi TaxID=2970926 RepID=A0ABT1ZGH5_9MICO|nr:hypothetical protein [Protaetiibacter mangrovi]MCS0499792.1 hypothetical protein [Protaetiibacter mangrovi]